ncbi:MAG: hypothetical protein CM15mV138_040 [Caudoviricetes sp.]|nr:MAG: hypothetical protein CM15mV138_040 [Caudoviricetes sp.]
MIKVGDLVQTTQKYNSLCPISGEVIEDYGHKVVIIDDCAEIDDDKLEFDKSDLQILRKTMPKGKYYEYQIKRSALDQDYLSGNIDDFQYARESLDLDLEYEPYILAQTINSEVAKKQHNIGDSTTYFVVVAKEYKEKKFYFMKETLI